MDPLITTTLEDLLAQRQKEKEKEVANLMDKIGNSKSYTIGEFRDIEVDVRKLAGLPPRDYSQTVAKVIL